MIDQVFLRLLIFVKNLTLRNKSTLASLLLLLVLFTRCASKADFVYLNGKTTVVETVAYEMKLQADDVISITVTSINPEITGPYNLQTGGTETTSGSPMSYLISKEGTIDFPILGSIAVGGLTRIATQNKIQDLLKEHIADAKVMVSLLNFKVTVLGEVNKPGTIQVPSERITILEAIGNAGDLSVFGKRKNILLIRERDGQTQTYRLDLTDPNLTASPHYYLAQNDVVYVEPNKTKINSSVVGPNITLGISAISLLITIIALTIR